MKERAILHVDMNNFYASVECMLTPELRKYPVAVCGSQEERQGIVLAKNYKAKAFGVMTGEAIWEAKQKCRELVIVPPHFEEYMKYSKLAIEIYGRYTDQIEPFGLDEVWADVTGSQMLFGAPYIIADEIRETVKRELGLTVSVGVSFNKVFAKLASDMKKPDAVSVIKREGFREQIYDLPASELFGVGRSTAKDLASAGIFTIGQMARSSCDFFERRLGKRGVELWKYANGLDDSPVVVRELDVPDKSVGHGRTSPKDLKTNDEVWRFMLELTQEIGHRLYVFNKKATGIAISVKDNTLLTRQWQSPISMPTQSPFCIAKEAFSLFERRYEWERPIRAISVRAIDLVAKDAPCQIDIFSDPERLEKTETIDKTIEALRLRFGESIIKNACLLNNSRGSEYPRYAITN